MQTDQKAVNIAKHITKVRLKSFKGTGTATNNQQVALLLEDNIQTFLSTKGYSLSQDKIMRIVLDEMVKTRGFQVGGTPYQVYWFRGMQIGLAVILVVLWALTLTLRDGRGNIYVEVYVAVTVASTGILYSIFTMSKMIKSFRRKNIIGR